MPYVIAPGSVMQITVEGRQENQQVLSVFTYKLTSASSLPDGNAALLAFFTAFGAAGGMLDNYSGCMSAQVTGLKSKLQWIYPDRFAFVTQVGDFTEGQVAGAAYPSNVAISITKRTQNAGRKQVGTLHMAGVPIAFVTNGALQAGGLSAYNLLGLEMMKNITSVGPAATFTPIHFHRVDPDVAQPLNTFEVARTARVMRRRTVGLGS